MSQQREEIRVVVVEPSAIVGYGVVAALNAAADIVVVESVSDLSLLTPQTMERLDADVVVINPSLIERGDRTQLRTAHPALSGLPLVAMAYDTFDEEYLRRFDAVVGLGTHPSLLVQRIRESVHNSEPMGDEERGDELSAREKDILVAVAGGATNKEIAERLNISVHTVVTHRKNISRKLGIRTISGLTVYAIMNNLIEVGG